MINLKVENGYVSLGEMVSSPTSVRFFTKGRYHSFGNKGGSTLVKAFLDCVLSQDQIQSAKDYASEQKDGKLYYKHFYRKCAEYLGSSPRNAIKLWNAAEYYTKIEPRKDLVDILARGRLGRVNREKFAEVVECEGKLREVQQDGLKNLLPFVLYFKMLPHELRKLYGKSAWKRIAANSFHRNSLLVKNIENIYSPYHSAPEKRYESLVSCTKTILPIRSTLLANEAYMRFFKRNLKPDRTMCEGFNFVYENRVTKMPMRHLNRYMLDKLERTTDYIEDTYRMARQLGENFNIWKHDIDSIQDIHNEMQRRLQEVREKHLLSPEPIACLDDITFKGLVIGDYSIDLLQSRYDIHQEGKTMGHCVGSYIERVVGGNYLVYSIKKNGERLSTLGIVRGMNVKVVLDGQVAEQSKTEEVKHWVFSQHYGRFNARIVDPMLGFLTDICLSSLNGKDFVSEGELKDIELAMQSVKDCVERDETQVDTLKFPVYNPESYKSVYDRNFK